MFLHPFTAIFMLVWLSVVGSAATQAGPRDSAFQFVPLGMFIFGVALTLGGFVPEAIKAKRILAAALGATGCA